MEWYYANDGQREGPVAAEELARLVVRGTVKADTLVWRAGMAEWQEWQAVAPTVTLPAVEDEPPPLQREIAPTFERRAEFQPTAPGPATDTGLPYAGFWIRLPAKLLDALILGLVGNVIGGVIFAEQARELQGINPEDPAALGLAFSMLGNFFLLSLALGLVYHWFFLAKFAATPGKLALGLRIVRDDGSPLSHGQIIGRFFTEYLSALILYIGYLIAAFDDEKRTLHDYLCKTRVIRGRTNETTRR
jgi:uncharacterized RDD family membrane protein YckC